MDSNLRLVPRSALMALARMLRDDTGSGENGQRPTLQSSRQGGLRRRTMVVLSSVSWVDPLSWLSRAFTSRSSVSWTVRLDERFPNFETHDKIGESLANVFSLRVDKGERTAAYTGRCRELFEKAAREGIELPDVVLGFLMLRGARLGPERKAIVLAAAGQSYTD